MRKILLLLFSFFSVLSIHAQLNGSGYYRVNNVGDGRYIYVTDNTGSAANVNNPDMGAVQLKKGLDKAISSPATVLYFEHISGNEYDLKSQGTSVKSIIGYTPSIYYSSRAKAYQVYAQVSGVTIYLGADSDPYYKNKEVSYLTTGSSGDYNLWNVTPLTSEGDNYFGITPSIEVDGKYYEPFYASFPFSFYSSGMTAYYVNSVQGIGAQLVPVEGSIIPAATPVIIECSSSDPSNNRLELLAQGGTAIKDNMLKGVYFENKFRQKSKDAITKYNKATMRVLGKTQDGKLGFVLSSDENLKANKAYLLVNEGSEEVILAMDEQQFSSIELPAILDDTALEVYTILGQKVRNISSVDNLPSGIFIVNGKKVIKK